jgi:hypothetical protein
MHHGTENHREGAILFLYRIPNGGNEKIKTKLGKSRRCRVPEKGRNNDQEHDDRERNSTKGPRENAVPSVYISPRLRKLHEGPITPSHLAES